MANGALLTGLFVLLTACGSKTELDARALDVSSESTAGAASGSAGTNAIAGSSGTGGGSGVPQTCTADDVIQPQQQMFPESSIPPGPVNATVLAVTDTGVQLATALGDAARFGWLGPSLLDRLAPGERVELSETAAWSIAEAPFWNILSASSTTLATVHMSLWVGLSEVPPAIDPFRYFWNLPQLEFVDADCCRHEGELICGYTLVAALNGQSVRIARGDRATLGEWQITNFGAGYAKGLVSFGLTALGPSSASTP